MKTRTLELRGNLQIEAAVRALESIGVDGGDMVQLIKHLTLDGDPIDGRRGQVVRNIARFSDERGLILRHMLMRGIERQLSRPDTPRTRVIAAEALREVLSSTNQEAL